MTTEAVETIFKLDEFRGKINHIGKVFAGKKPKGLEEYFDRYVFNGKTLYASTHEVGMSVDLKTPFKVVVDGKRLKNIVGTFDGDHLSVYYINGALKLVCGGAEAMVQCFNYDEQASLMPEADLPNARTFSLSADQSQVFATLIERTNYLTGGDDPRPAVHSIYFIDSEEETIAYSSDSKSAMRAKINGHRLFDCDITLSEFFAGVLSGYLGGPILFRVTKECIQAQISTNTDSVLIQGAVSRSAKNITEFKETLDKVIDQVKQLPKAPAPKLLPVVIDQVSVVADDKIAPSIKLDIKEKKLVASADSDGVASIRSAPIDCEMDDFEVQVDPRVIKLFYQQNLTPSEITFGKERVGFFDEGGAADMAFVSAVMR